jgi:predicted secreted hydrolase
VDLQFLGTTAGYKGKILRGWYGPVLPKAIVNGYLLLNGKQIEVTGVGYQEHGWGIPPLLWEWGWYFGKIMSDSYTLFWGRLMLNRWREQVRTAVLSQDQSGYINIKPENFKLKAKEYKFNNMRIIPTKFILNIADPNNAIFINATLETINIHQLELSIFRCWRYHVLVNGEISYGSSIEEIKDEIHIMELVRFR